MDFGEIPDDIWISIFEQVDDPSTLAILVRTCRRFHGLASKLLLRELKWIKPELTLRNIEAWAGVYSTLVALPRKITIGIPFEFTHVMRVPIPSILTVSPEMRLHDVIHTQLLRFTSITEICLDGTVISPHSYCVLGRIATLRSLRLENCSFINLHVSFDTRTALSYSSVDYPQPTPPLGCPLEIISAVPVTHLSLHRLIVPSEYENYRYHPLSLLTISTLRSLSITWNANIAARYAQDRWALPSLTDLSVVMPLMSRDLLDELATLVQRCESSPRFKLKIDKHNLSDTQMNTVHVPSKGLWNYQGPLVIVAGSATKSRRPTLTHVKINETLELPPLLDGLEKLPSVIEELKVQVGKWDIELLFAIKELFKGIKKLEVRYARGSLPDNLLVRLGADILFCLPDLMSIKLLGPKPQEEPDSDRSSGIIGGSGANSPGFGTGFSPPHASNPGHTHPQSSASVFHNVLVGGGIGITQNGSGYDDNHDLCFDFESSILDGEQDELRFGGRANVTPNLTSTRCFSSSGSSFQSNRPGPRNWNPASSVASPSALTTASESFSVSSTSRRAGFFARKQVRTERQKSRTSDKPEVASPLSQAELGDYLVGWSRYCPSLRVVQIDHRWWWERRFAGDQWTLRVHRHENARNNDKGKEREGVYFGL